MSLLSLLPLILRYAVKCEISTGSSYAPTFNSQFFPINCFRNPVTCVTAVTTLTTLLTVPTVTTTTNTTYVTCVTNITTKTNFNVVTSVPTTTEVYLVPGASLFVHYRVSTIKLQLFSSALTFTYVNLQKALFCTKKREGSGKKSDHQPSSCAITIEPA